MVMSGCLLCFNQVDTCLVSPNNRMGQPLNMHYVHVGLGTKSIKNRGYDPKRPQPGIVKENKSSEGIAKLQKHNYRLMQGNDLYPPMYPDKAHNETLANSHLTCIFRLHKCQKQSTITGEAFIAPPDETYLQMVLDEGYDYYVLVEALPDEDAQFISEYRNADQNQNKSFDPAFHVERITLSKNCFSK